MNLKEKLKIQWINPEFEDLLFEGYELNKNNSKKHKKNAAIKKEKNSLRYGQNKTKLKQEHRDFLKILLDDENRREQICLKSLAFLIYN